MKHLMKTFALLGLSACLLTSGAIAACAQTPDAVPSVSGFTALSRKNSDCGGHHADAALTAQFKDADGTLHNYTLCAEGGEVDGKRNALTKVHAVFSRYDGDAYTGTLDNGEQILTLVCYEDDKHAAKTDNTTVYVLLSVLEGHDAYLVNTDGTETKIEVQPVGREGKFHIDLRDGAALVHLVPKAEP